MPDDLDGMQAADADPDGAGGDPSKEEPLARSSGSTDGEMTPEEAARTVDSVEEGRPQVVARPGAAGDKDW